jgi:two-component system sensor histidine kinase/response regulator
MKQLFSSVYNLIAPAHIDPGAPEVERDAFALTTIMAFFSGALFAPVYFVIGDYHGAVAIILFAIPLACAPLLLRLTRSVNVALHWLSASELFILSYLAYRQGGVDDSAAIWWTLLVPWAYWTAGIYRAGMFWLGMVLLPVAAMYAYEVFVEPLPSIKGNDPHLLYLLSIVGFFAIALAYLALSDRFRRKAFAELVRTNVELAEARDAALAAAQAKAQFLANMSHEIRTPMHGMLGTAQLLEAMPLTVDAKHLAKVVTQSGESLLSLINDILDFSKIEAGQLTLDTVAFSPGALVEDVADLLAPLAYEGGLEISCRTSAGLPSVVRGDPLRLRQVLANLLSNAIKFTDQGEVAISVEAVPQADSQRVRLRFEVNDTGIGIAQEQRDRLFTAFSQIDDSSTRRYGGSGLGLAISRDLITMMGGEITVDSNVGKGSHFVVEVPFNEETETPSDRPALENGPGNTVLLLEPHRASRRAVEEKLEQTGARVIAPEFPLDVEELRRHVKADAGKILVSSSVLADEPSSATASRNDVLALPWRKIVMAPFGQTANWGRSDQGAMTVIAKPARMSVLRDVLARPEAKAEENVVMGQVSRDGASTTRVLLAEDNPVNQKIAIAMLERMGCSIDVVGDGEAAVNATAENNYDLILMDCQMPLLDGFDATRAIREREENGGGRHTPIVALTASALSGDREACLASGMDDYVAKPFKLEQLRQVVTKWSADAWRD